MMRARLFPLALAVAACGGGVAPPGARVSAANPCFIPARGVSLTDSVIFAAEGDVYPASAPRVERMIPPRSLAERVVYAQAYETLVRFTCEGKLAPALAERWTGDSTGRVWTLTIRSDVTFWQGLPVTADVVADVWRDRRIDLGASAGRVRDAVERVTITGEREITVHFREGHRDGPRLLADPYFAVAHRPGPHLTQHRGTGPYRFRVLNEPDGMASGDPSAIILGPDVAGAGPVLVLRTMRSADARDFIDRGVDVLVTSDRRVTDYASTRPELHLRPLQPDRAYVLLSTARSAADAPLIVPDDDPRWAVLRASLARDVIRTSSPRAPDRWWGSHEQAAACAVTPPESAPAWSALTAAPRARRLVYSADDPVSGDLARRLVALATYDGGASTESSALRELLPELLESGAGPLVAAALSDGELTASLRRGADLGYLLALPRRSLDACAAWRQLAVRAPWVGAPVPALLAEAGPTLITGPRAPGLIVEWDNALRVVTRIPSARSPR